MLPSRLARAVLPILTPLLALQSQAGRDEDGAQGSKGRKGKKRARNYEGDELFKSREVVCPTQNDGSAVLNALDGESKNILPKSMCSSSLSRSASKTHAELTAAHSCAIARRPNSPRDIRFTPPNPTQPLLTGPQPPWPSLRNCAAHVHGDRNWHNERHGQDPWLAYRDFAARGNTFCTCLSGKLS